jgi:hypothetical protein
MGIRLVKHARCYWLLPVERHLTQRLFGANRAAAGDAVGARRVADGVVAANLSGKEVEEEGVRDIGCRRDRMGLRMTRTGLGALLYPLHVRLPFGLLAAMAAAPWWLDWP